MSATNKDTLLQRQAKKAVAAAKADTSAVGGLAYEAASSGAYLYPLQVFNLGPARLATSRTAG